MAEGLSFAVQDFRDDDSIHANKPVRLTAAGSVTNKFVRILLLKLYVIVVAVGCRSMAGPPQHVVPIKPLVESNCMWRP